MSAADWVEAHTKRKLTPFQRIAVDVLCAGLGAPWNVNVKWDGVDWDHGHGVAFALYTNELATFDFDRLTALVLAAHDSCVRLAIAPRAFRYLTISIHPRAREGGIARRHPTIEQAIELFRRHRKEPA